MYNRGPENKLRLLTDANNLSFLVKFNFEFFQAAAACFYSFN